MMEAKDSNSIEQILSRIQSLEVRLSKIESQISSGAALESASIESIDTEQDLHEEKREAFWETSVGNYGLGWLANIVFIFGIGFVMAYIKSIGYPITSAIIGIAGVLSMYGLGYLLKKHFYYIAFLVNINAFLLLFYVVGYLHFLSSPPILSSKILGLVLLFLVVGGQIYFALRRNSEALAGVSIVILLATAVFSGTTHIMLPIVALATVLAVYFFIKYEWWRVLIISILLVYFTHLDWLFNNPIMGNQMGTVESPQYNLIYLLFYASVFSLPMVLRHWKKTRDSVFVSVMLINGIAFFLTTLLVILPFYAESYGWIFGIVSVLFLAYSVILKLRSKLSYSPAFYACYSFIALSVVIYAYNGFPDSYLLLVLQSLLVVSLAIWYRSGNKRIFPWRFRANRR